MTYLYRSAPNEAIILLSQEIINVYIKASWQGDDNIPAESLFTFYLCLDPQRYLGPLCHLHTSNAFKTTVKLSPNPRGPRIFTASICKAACVLACAFALVADSAHLH